MLEYSGSSYATFCQQVKALGTDQPTRQGMSKELTMTSFEVTPGDYIPAAKTRKFNLGFSLAEFVSLVTGIDSIGVFTRHISNYSKFSTDGVRLDNSYGGRAHSQIARCLEILGNVETEDARYAVVTINNGSTDLWTKSGHLPCTLSIQWLVRNGELLQQVNMRSNDIVKGVSYDVASFGWLHIFMAQNLGLKVGKYVQTAGSLHCYEYDYDLVNSMTNDEPLLLDYSKHFNALDLPKLAVAVLTEDFSTLPVSWVTDLAFASFARWDKSLFNKVSSSNRDVLARTHFLRDKV